VVNNTQSLIEVENGVVLEKARDHKIVTRALGGKIELKRKTGAMRAALQPSTISQENAVASTARYSVTFRREEIADMGRDGSRTVF
jgi:hypothetical protein